MTASSELPRFSLVPDEFLSAGDIIADRYRVEYPLGSGGFAQVVLASHLEVDSLKVAVKVVHPHRLSDDTLRRFRNEAQLLARLRNRHTVKLTDFGVSTGNLAYLVMEYVEGTPLDRVIHAKGRLSEADTARVGIGVLKSLVEAHSVGVIHRDLKPANIMMVVEVGERHPVPRVLDFGIAKVLGGGSPVEDHIVHPDGSFEPIVYCTPAYAAPELLRGRPHFATDLYALGLVLCEVLDGMPPYEYPDDEPANSPHLWESAVPLGKHASASRLRPVLERALAKHLADRYVSAEEMLDDLERVYDDLRRGSMRSPPIDVVNIPQAGKRDPSQAARLIQTSVVAAVGGGDVPRPPTPGGGEHSTGVLWTPPDRVRRSSRSEDQPTVPTRTPPPRRPATDRAHPHPRSVSESDSGPLRSHSGGLPRLAESGASSQTRAPMGHGGPEAPLSAPPVDEQLSAPVLPMARREDSRLAEIPLFGQRVLSTKAKPASVAIVVLAIALPAVIAAYSVFAYLRAESTPPRVVPHEVEDK